MSQLNPYTANNGLRVTARSSQSISLTWQTEVVKEAGESGREILEETDDRNAENEVELVTNEVISDQAESVERNNNWFHVQMKRGESSIVWESIYKGYSTRCQVQALPPDSVMIFRMKRNDENEWGSEITASTETLIPSVEDLNRAVEMHSEYLVSRILKLTKPTHLKRILRARDRNGMTALMVASQTGNPTVVENLISLGCEVNAVSSGSFRTALMFACMMGHQGVVLILDKCGAKWKTKDKSGCTAMDYVINRGLLPLVKLAYSRLGKAYLLEEHSMCGWTPLLRATIASDNLNVLKFFIKKGADVNYCSEVNDKTPLMAAILAKKANFVKVLLENGANPFYQNNNGTSCLQAARGLQYREITEIITNFISALDHDNDDVVDVTS